MDERNKRFETLYRDTLPGFLEKTHIVIGCGAIGGPIIKALGQMGINSLEIWDHDTIEEVNIGPQGFSPQDITGFKVNARGIEFDDLNPDSKLKLHKEKFQKRYDHPKDAFWWLCVDSLDAREFIFKAAITCAPEKIIDMRMGGLIYEVYNADLQEDENKYLETIEWTRNNLVQDSCTSRSTPHASMVAAAIGINLALTKLPPFAIKGNLMDYSQEVIW